MQMIIVINSGVCMQYLCLSHRVQVARSAALARKLWLSALQHGQAAMLDKNWPSAERFFGCAFEIAKIRMNDRCRGQLSAFDEAPLVASAQYFAQALCELQRFEQANSVAQLVRHHLVRKIAQSKATENKSVCLQRYLNLMEPMKWQVLQ